MSFLEVTEADKKEAKKYRRRKKRFGTYDVFHDAKPAIKARIKAETHFSGGIPKIKGRWRDMEDRCFSNIIMDYFTRCFNDMLEGNTVLMFGNRMINKIATIYIKRFDRHYYFIMNTKLDKGNGLLYRGNINIHGKWAVQCMRKAREGVSYHRYVRQGQR